MFSGYGNDKLYKVTAIVLKRIRFGEADFLVTLLTSPRGKITATVKGALKTRSKLGGHLELLNYCRLVLAEGTNIDIVSQAETIDSFLELRSDLWRTSLAIYMAELIDRSIPEQLELDKVFSLLLDNLRLLCKTTKPDLLVRFFEIHLMDLLGYRPQLHKCVNCDMAIQPVKNYFSPASGGILCLNCGNEKKITTTIDVNTVKVLRFLQKSKIDEINTLKINQESLLSIEVLLRSYINYFIEKEIKSTRWLDRLRRERA